MNYRHAYHAGNFSDVIKHCVLISIFRSLARKDKAFAYLDTHAGSGLYHLESQESQKTEEYKHGIEKIREYIRDFDSEDALIRINAEKIPETVKIYFKTIQKLSPGLHDYPGSVMFAHAILKGRDSIIACEMVPEEASKLRKNIKLEAGYQQNLETNPDFKAFPKIAIHQQDGYQGLKSFLPFKEKRGLIFIDPPFEKNSEWTDLLKYINLAYSRFPQGIYAIWYPIKDQHEVRNFLQKMVQEFSEPECKDLKTRPQILNIECVLDSAYSCMTTRIRKTDYSNSLMGTGMLILNPPWQIELELEVVINWLWTKMQFNEKGFCSVKWLMRDYIC